MCLHRIVTRACFPGDYCLLPSPGQPWHDAALVEGPSGPRAIPLRMGERQTEDLQVPGSIPGPGVHQSVLPCRVKLAGLTCRGEEHYPAQ